jgi:hypothetical protein
MASGSTPELKKGTHSMENTQPPIESPDHTEADSVQRRPFIEPTLTPAGDVFDVTRNYLFMMMQSGGFSGGGDGGDV